MKHTILLALAFMAAVASSCSSDDAPAPEADYLTINGITKPISSDGLPGTVIYFNGGGYVFDGQNGIYLTQYANLNINDPENAFLGAFGNEAVSGSFLLRVVTDTETKKGAHTTVSDGTGAVGDDKVFSQLVTGGTTYTAAAGQKMEVTYAADEAVIRFRDVTYGTLKVSGKWTIHY
jgi:hypothetical protein